MGRRHRRRSLSASSGGCAQHGRELTGLKSSLQDTKVETKALDKGNCSTARESGMEAGIKRRAYEPAGAEALAGGRGTGCEAGDADEFARQSEVLKVSASQVMLGVVSGKFTSLPEGGAKAGGGEWAASCYFLIPSNRCARYTTNDDRRIQVPIRIGIPRNPRLASSADPFPVGMDSE